MCGAFHFNPDHHRAEIPSARREAIGAGAARKRASSAMSGLRT